ncbi:MAG: virulence RhuM family protein [Bacteroidales bacterium]|nr:virulence RhuM family protein [Bacteroidales bacterium]
MQDKNEIVLYQPDETIRLEVRMENETVWLTQNQIAELFGTQRPAITKHLNNIFRSQELEENSVSSILERTATDGKTYNTKYYNLDAILSVGYRVNSINATRFRKWANTILKDYLLRGYSVSHKIESLEQAVQMQFQKYDTILLDHQRKIDFFVHTTIPPVEGLFYEGQVFDARACVENLIKKAQKEVIIIDAYVDASTFEMLDVRSKGVSATIYTERLTHSLLKVKELHDAQYPDKIVHIEKYSENFHDRFLIIDDTVYHFGASFKDLGRRLFAFNKMGLEKEVILLAVKHQ